ncbi:hypothetical protein EUGRSUZ_F00126 [Eucalyptus grandis]|uniref:Uncharacterized protein n=2 Tax=Eucalyptus grandis TaxID=71139 RepID=A0ACC3KAE0_EUCGR|nr:hypothetical protein EUGRSUZ_F00126 [Eucalyptus grandis]
MSIVTAVETPQPTQQPQLVSPSTKLLCPGDLVLMFRFLFHRYISELNVMKTHERRLCFNSSSMQPSGASYTSREVDISITFAISRMQSMNTWV